MQEHTTKDSEFSKARRSNPIHVVDTSRLVSSNNDALREVHMSLVRAEQNLLNLVQSNQAAQAANGVHFGHGGFTYPVAQNYPSSATVPAYAPGFAPGFPPSPGLTIPSGFQMGIAPNVTPWGTFAQPGLTPWGTVTPPGLTPWGTLAQPGVTPWAPTANGITAAPLGPLANMAGTIPGTWNASQSPYGFAAANRIPACDIADEGKQFVCQLDLPGMRAEQIEVLCLEQAIIINAYRETEGDIANVVQSERGTATLQRSIILPAEIQPANSKATLSNGVLSIVLPKVHATEGPRRIKVQG